MQDLKSVKNPKIAFTTQFDNKVRVLKTKIGISPYKKNQPINPQPAAEGLAIWDTGATGTVISPGVASSLNLKPIGKRPIAGVTGQSQANEYIVNLFLPNRVQLRGVPVVEADVLGAQVLIGMDIITMGDFAVTNHGGRTKLSYQMPSTNDVDFVRDIEKQKKKKTSSRRLKKKIAQKSNKRKR